MRLNYVLRHWGIWFVQQLQLRKIRLYQRSISDRRKPNRGKLVCIRRIDFTNKRVRDPGMLEIFCYRKKVLFVSNHKNHSVCIGGNSGVYRLANGMNNLSGLKADRQVLANNNVVGRGFSINGSCKDSKHPLVLCQANIIDAAPQPPSGLSQ